MAAALGMPLDELQGHVLTRRPGCLHCRQTGYIGRDGIFQIMPITEKVRGLIARQTSSIDLFEAARAGRHAHAARSGHRKSPAGRDDGSRLWCVM